MPTHACVGCSLQEQRNISSSFCGIKKRCQGFSVFRSPIASFQVDLRQSGLPEIRSMFIRPHAKLSWSVGKKRCCDVLFVAPFASWQYSTVLRTCQGKNEKFINLKIQRASPFFWTHYLLCWNCSRQGQKERR